MARNQSSFITREGEVDRQGNITRLKAFNINFCAPIFEGNDMANRIKDMENAIKDYRDNRLTTMQSHVSEYVSALNPIFCKALNIVMKVNAQ